MSTIAKLLATENITVVYGNYKTAFFDLKQRTLGLPNWKHMTKNIRELMEGHEVGHALETPPEGYHGAQKHDKIPGSMLNIVEDVRIERKIQARYPGLVPSFLKGYKELFELNFFGTEGREWDTFNFIDRINIKSKLRDLADVPFTAEEKVLFDKVDNTDTFEDVVAVCLELMEHIENNKLEMPEQPQDQEESDEGQDPTDGSGSEQSSDDQEDGQEDQSQDDNGSGSSDDETSEESEESEEQQSQEPAKSQSADVDPNSDDSAEDAPTDPFASETDDAFRENEKKAGEELESEPTTIHSLTKKQTEESIQDMMSEADDLEELKQKFIESSYDKDYAIKELQTITDGLQAFIKDSKNAVNVMVKEFEMRKNASRNARAQEAKKGSLNTEKLHAYKYSDDIFKRVTNLADAKNHGMVMFIDLSGSMNGTIGDVVKQVIQLSMFCKAVKIPYEVYTFTTGHRLGNYSSVPGFVSHDSLNIVKVLSSELKRTDYNKALDMLWGSHVRKAYTLATQQMGGTPLVPTLMAAHHIVPAFKAKHKVEKINTIFLTDGEPTTTSVNGYYGRRGEIQVGKTILPIKNLYVDAVVKLSDNLKKVTGGDVINFFIAENTRDAMSYAAKRNGFGCEEANEIRKNFRKGTPVAIDSIKGSDLTVFVQAGKFSGTDDDFEVNDNISKQQMKKQFGKFMNSKKNNRIIFTKFAKKVAEAA